MSGLFEIHGCKQVSLFAVDVRDPTDRSDLVDADALTLDTPQLCQGGFGIGGVGGGLEDELFVMAERREEAARAWLELTKDHLDAFLELNQGEPSCTYDR